MEEDIIKDTIDLSHIIVMEDLSHETVEQVTFTENIPNGGKDMLNLIKVN